MGSKVGDPDTDPDPHCEKSLFVLASRQKIPVLKEENPTVDTRTICLPPIEFLKITNARKATAGKSCGQKQQIRLENPGLLVSGGRLFTFLAGKGNSIKSRQVTTETAGKFGCQ
jgi:hypothetical protein